jgi:hypothetical protein
MRVLLAAAFALASADAATRVAVIELGKSGTVRRTTAKDAQTSAEGVASFWSSLHGYGRKLQHAGMTVVPDLFSRPDSGVVVGLNGVDLDNMPNLNAMMKEEGENGVVGHMEVPGQQGSVMLKFVKDVEKVNSSSLARTCHKKAAEGGISGVKMQVTDETASDVDAQLDAMVKELSKDAVNSGKTIVLHIIVEEEEGAARRRRMARRLSSDEDEDEDGDNGDEDGDADEDADADADGSYSQYSGYYGYGYYNSYGEWVSEYNLFQLSALNQLISECSDIPFFLSSGHPLQDYVPNPILQRCLVDFCWIGGNSLLLYLHDGVHASNGRHATVWRVRNDKHGLVDDTLLANLRHY